MFNYGNQQIGENITTFWLEDSGPVLKISPMEQLIFLKNLDNRRFPLKERTYSMASEIMCSKLNLNTQICVKTGSATKNWRGHGWYIGMLKTSTDTWYFVTNIEINEFNDLKKRRQITLEIFKLKNII